MAAPVGILVLCLQTDLPNQFRLNAKSLLKYTNRTETFWRLCTAWFTYRMEIGNRFVPPCL